MSSGVVTMGGKGCTQLRFTFGFGVRGAGVTTRRGPHRGRRLRARWSAQCFQKTADPFLLALRRRATRLRLLVRRRRLTFLRIARGLAGEPFENERQPGEAEKDERVVHRRASLGVFGRRLFRGADRLAHRGVGLHVFHPHVIHDAEIAGAERVRHRLRDERFGFHHFGAHFLRLGAHLLLDRDGRGAAHFGFRLGDALVGVGLLGLQFRADVVANIDVGDIDRENLEGRAAIESFCSTSLEIRSGFSSTSL